MEYKLLLHPGVEKEIKKWPMLLCARFKEKFKRVCEHGLDLGMPHSRSLGKGIFELRIEADTNIARGVYCFMKGSKIYVLHAFIKKTQKIPYSEMRIIKQRYKEVRRGN